MIHYVLIYEGETLFLYNEAKAKSISGSILFRITVGQLSFFVMSDQYKKSNKKLVCKTCCGEIFLTS